MHLYMFACLLFCNIVTCIIVLSFLMQKVSRELGINLYILILFYIFLIPWQEDGPDLVSIIKGAHFYRSGKYLDYVSDYVPLTLSEFNKLYAYHRYVIFCQTYKYS